MCNYIKLIGLSPLKYSSDPYFNPIHAFLILFYVIFETLGPNIFQMVCDFSFLFCNIFKYERIVNIFLKLKTIWLYMITREWHYLLCTTEGYLSKFIDALSISLKTLTYKTFESQIVKTNMCSYHQWGDQTFVSAFFSYFQINCFLHIFCNITN